MHLSKPYQTAYFPRIPLSLLLSPRQNLSDCPLTPPLSCSIFGGGGGGAWPPETISLIKIKPVLTRFFIVMHQQLKSSNQLKKASRWHDIYGGKSRHESTISIQNASISCLQWMAKNRPSPLTHMFCNPSGKSYGSEAMFHRGICWW